MKFSLGSEERLYLGTWCLGKDEGQYSIEGMPKGERPCFFHNFI